MIRQEGDRFKVSGSLTMATVAGLHGALDAASRPGAALVVDLSGVETVDSAAVGLLLAWRRRAGKDGAELRYEHLPDNLLSLANMYGVAELLPV